MAQEDDIMDIDFNNFDFEQLDMDFEALEQAFN